MTHYDSLQELTGHESGCINYNGKIFIMNWAEFHGLPNFIGDDGEIGLNKEIINTKKCKTPRENIHAMKKHEKQNNCTISKKGYTSYSINDGLIIVTVNFDWH